jgi:short subunit dehydrogenase-like uncharacterized protein
MPSNFLVYGANGYTGELIAREAVARGQRPILAGRNGAAVETLARELGLEARVFGLDDAAGLERGLGGVQAVMHGAGPFSRTSRPMAAACLRARAAYLDITGEVEVFEGLHAQDAEARRAGVLLLPGVGFDVVPTDGLAAHLKRRLPTATRLTLAFMAGGRPSRGTATTVVINLHKGGLVRRGGRLTPIAPGSRVRSFDFGRGPRDAVCIPWGDVSTAYHSTGIGDVEVYTVVPPAVRLALRLAGPLRGLLGTKAVRGLLERRVRAGPAGPDAEARAGGRSVVVGEVEDPEGRRARARLLGPEGYTFTVATAVRAVERVLAEPGRAGFATPSLAFGPDFALEVPGVTREDLPA